MSLDKKIVPKAASDIKLINAGKILENGKTVARCETPFDDDLPKSVITMHVIVQPSPTKPRPGLILLLSHLSTSCLWNGCLGVLCSSVNLFLSICSIAEKKLKRKKPHREAFAHVP